MIGKRSETCRGPLVFGIDVPALARPVHATRAEVTEGAPRNGCTLWAALSTTGEDLVELQAAALAAEKLVLEIRGRMRVIEAEQSRAKHAAILAAAERQRERAAEAEEKKRLAEREKLLAEYERTGGDHETWPDFLARRRRELVAEENRELERAQREIRAQRAREATAAAARADAAVKKEVLK